MTDQRCERYLEDPEANAAHLQECEACRTLAKTLDEPAAAAPAVLDVDALPLAPWEGATHRSWPLVLSLGLAVLLLALILCFAAGTSITNAVTSSVGSFDMLRALVRMAGDAVWKLPKGLQVVVLIAFVAVNALLYALLRRAPRGIDA
jgi:hypothetical protein